MSSLDMDAYFNIVTHENLPHHLYAGCRLPAEANSPPELLNASELDILAAPVFDPFHEEQALYKSAGQAHVRQSPQQVLPAPARLSAKLSADVAHSELAQTQCAAESARVSSNFEQQDMLSRAAQKPADLHLGDSCAHESQAAANASQQAESDLCGSQIGDTSVNSSGAKVSSDHISTGCADIDSERHIGQDTRQSKEAKPQPITADRAHPPPSVLTTLWPRMTHAPKLRHGKQLRKAAVEAAAAAAGQAARAESAVRLQTPPTIAFHSAAAQHAMAAAEEAAAAAAVCADYLSDAHCPDQRAGHSGAQSAAELEAGPSVVGQLRFSASRAGRLHASAPASPVHPSSARHRACHGLWDSAGNHAEDCVGFAAVHAPANANCHRASHGQTMIPHKQADTGLLSLRVSAPSLPVSSHNAARLLRQQHQQQIVSLSANRSQHHHKKQQQQIASLSANCSQHHHKPQQQQQHQDRPESWRDKVNLQMVSDGAEQSRHSQQPQHEQQAQQAQHGLGTQLPIEDPFKASEQFPVCPELSLWLPRSIKQIKQYDLLADCTNQLASIQSQQFQHLRLPVKSRAKHRPRAEAATAVRQEYSTAAQTDSCPNHDKKGLGHALRIHTADKAQHALRTHVEDRAQPASELSSLTENEFWEAARGDLLDTAEAVRHQSRVNQLSALTPVRMEELSLYPSGQHQTPLPRLQAGLTHQRGITPLLGNTLLKQYALLCQLL